MFKNVTPREKLGQRRRTEALSTLMPNTCKKKIINKEICKKERPRKSNEYVNKKVEKMPEGRSLSIKEVDEEILRSKRAYDYRCYV